MTIYTAVAAVSVNFRESCFGYTDGQEIATVDAFDVEAETPAGALEAIFTIGNRMAADVEGKRWPSDVRSLSVGDAVCLIAPDGKADEWHAVARCGWTPITVNEEYQLVALEGTEATSRVAS